MKLNIIIEKYTTIIIVKGTNTKVFSKKIGSIRKTSFALKNQSH